MSQRFAFVASVFNLVNVIGTAAGAFLAFLTSMAWARDVAKEWPDPVKVGFYVAIFVVLAGCSIAVTRVIRDWYRIFVRRVDPTPPSTHADEVAAMVKEIRDDLLGVTEQTPRPPRFSPHALIADRPRLDLAPMFRLSDPGDPTFTVFVNLKNVSPYAVTITGVDGQLTIDGRACTLARTKRMNAHRLVDASDYWTLEIEQPVSQQMREYVVGPSFSGAPGGLVSRDSILRINLGGLQLQGTVEGPNGPEPLKGCHLGIDTFTVRGPVDDADSAARLQLWEPIFADSKHFDNVGRLRD